MTIDSKQPICFQSSPDNPAYRLIRQFFVFLLIVSDLSELDSTDGCQLVGIGGVCGQSYLLARLREQLLRPSGVTAEIVVIVLLGLVNFFPGLLDEFLGGAHVSVSLANVYRWGLRKYHRAKGKGRAERDAYEQNSLNHGFVPHLFPPIGKMFQAGLARHILRNFNACC
jgi:hypothetical protein